MHIQQLFSLSQRKGRIGQDNRAHRPVLADNVVRNAQVTVRTIQIGRGLRDARISNVALFHGVVYKLMNQYNLSDGRRIGAIRSSNTPLMRSNSSAARVRYCAASSGLVFSKML